MNKTTIVIIVFILFVSKSFAADTIIVHKDPRLDMFTEKQSAVNKLASKMTRNGMYKGYRLQVLNTRQREDAFNLKSELLQKFPSEQTYVLFQSPYFKVRIGNFLRKSDALSFKKKFLKSYAQDAYIVEDAIEYNGKGDFDVTSN